MSIFADLVKNLKFLIIVTQLWIWAPKYRLQGKKAPSQSLNMRSQGRNGMQTWAQLQKTGSTNSESNPWWKTLSFQLQKSWKNEAIITGLLMAGFTMTMSKWRTEPSFLWSYVNGDIHHKHGGRKILLSSMRSSKLTMSRFRLCTT